MSISICEPEVNARGKVDGYAEYSRGYLKKLLAMGLTKGVEFTITRITPMGDSVKINLRGFNLTIIKAESCQGCCDCKCNLDEKEVYQWQE